MTSGKRVACLIFGIILFIVENVWIGGLSLFFLCVTLLSMSDWWYENVPSISVEKVGYDPNEKKEDNNEPPSDGCPS